MATPTSINVKICLRQGTDEYCRSFNGMEPYFEDQKDSEGNITAYGNRPLLLVGEPIFNTTTKVLKIGNGTSTYDNLESYYLGTEIDHINYSDGTLTITKKSSGKINEQTDFSVNINNISKDQLASELATEINNKYVLPENGIPSADIHNGAITLEKISPQAQSDIASTAVEDAWRIVAAQFSENEAYYDGNYVIYNGKLYHFTTFHYGAWTGEDAVQVILSNEIECVLSTIAATYDTEEMVYSPGDYAIHNLWLYRCINVTSGTWVAADWEQVTVGEALQTLKEAISAAYPTETVTKTTRAHTLLGADGLPFKSTTVKQTDGPTTTWILRRCGKNLIDRSSIKFQLCNGAYNTFDETSGILTRYQNGAYFGSATYIPVVPGARLVSRGIAGYGGNYTNRIAFYDADKTFIEIQNTQVKNTDYAVTVPNNAFFFRFLCPASLVQYKADVPYYHLKPTAKVQFEILDNPKATTADATAYEEYNGIDVPVVISALNTPVSISPPPPTLLGQNVFSLFPQDALDDTDPTVAIDTFSQNATMDVTYRLDPTLAYNNLKTAIAALGPT